MVTDGSVKDGYGGYGAITEQRKENIEYCGRVNGDSEKINSYRVEAGGAALMMVQKRSFQNHFTATTSPLSTK